MRGYGTGIVGISMVLLPVLLFAAGGMANLLRWKWGLAAAELLLMLVFLMLTRFKDTEKEEEETEENGWEICIHEDMQEEFPLYPALEDDGTIRIGKEPEEEEMQTVLLTAQPVYQENRRLVSVGGDVEIPVRYFPFIIGKNKTISDYCLNEPGVSRLHVKLEQAEGGYLVTDLNSTNGTRVDGRMLGANETCELPPGSELTIAAMRFRFQ